MKLELKHLAPYQEHKVKIYVRQGSLYRIAWLSTKNIAVINPKAFGEVKKIKWEYASGRLKPVLHPLSDLTKEIEMPFGKVVPMEWMFKEDWTEWDGESECPLFMKHTYLCASGKVFPKFLPYWIVQQLAEMHFDLFELIENNLAIDINSIENVS